MLSLRFSLGILLSLYGRCCGVLAKFLGWLNISAFFTRHLAAATLPFPLIAFLMEKKSTNIIKLRKDGGKDTYSTFLIHFFVPPTNLSDHNSDTDLILIILKICKLCLEGEGRRCSCPTDSAWRYQRDVQAQLAGSLLGGWSYCLSQMNFGEIYISFCNTTTLPATSFHLYSRRFRVII